MRTVLRIACLCILLLPGPAGAAPMHRILALSPHICEMLYAIHAEKQVVGAVSYCDYPAAAKRLPRVGSYVGVDVEAALRLKPDVAVVMSRSVKGVETLQKMGVRIVVSNPQSFEDIFNDILKLGVLTGHGTQAGALVGQLRRQLQRVRAMPRSGTRVFFEVWPDPLLTAGGPSFINDLIHEAGGRNVFADIPIDTPHVSVESVIRARPELIVLPLEKRSFAKRRAFWEKWLGKGRVRFAAIDSDLLHRPGPRLIKGLELLHKAMGRQSDAR